MVMIMVSYLTEREEMLRRLFVLVVTRARLTCQFLPRAGFHAFAQRLGVRVALNLAIAGRHKGVPLGLAMKFVNRAPDFVNIAADG